MAEGDAISRLARQIGAIKKAEQLLGNADQIRTLRREGAVSLHRICAEFVASLNKVVSDSVELSPPVYGPDLFREPGANMIQVSAQGRQLQIVFEAPALLVSTEKFAIPYILEGEVRTFNQSMLERFAIRSLLIFFCVERETATWRFFDWRTRHSGSINSDFLARLMEPLF